MLGKARLQVACTIFILPPCAYLLVHNFVYRLPFISAPTQPAPRPVILLHLYRPERQGVSLLLVPMPSSTGDSGSQERPFQGKELFKLYEKGLAQYCWHIHTLRGWSKLSMVGISREFSCQTLTKLYQACEKFIAWPDLDRFSNPRYQEYLLPNSNPFLPSTGTLVLLNERDARIF